MAAKKKTAAKGAAGGAAAKKARGNTPAPAKVAPAKPAKTAAPKSSPSGIVYSDLRRELLAKRLLGR